MKYPNPILGQRPRYYGNAGSPWRQTGTLLRPVRLTNRLMLQRIKNVQRHGPTLGGSLARPARSVAECDFERRRAICKNIVLLDLLLRLIQGGSCVERAAGGLKLGKLEPRENLSRLSAQYMTCVYVSDGRLRHKCHYGRKRSYTAIVSFPSMAGVLTVTVR